MTNDLEARRRRAERLRRQMDDVGGGAESPAEDDEAPAGPRRDAPQVPPRAPSARDFVERRMRELDRKKDGDE